jgi:multiple sugar transport system substrate-binding protein
MTATSGPTSPVVAATGSTATTTIKETVMTVNRKNIRLVALALATPLALGACSSGSSGAGGGPVEIDLWTHSAGTPAEEEVIDKIIADFNASQNDYEVTKESFPATTYNDSVTGAAAAGDLPCLLDVDAPVMPNWAWAGWLKPTGLEEADVADFLPSTVGTYEDEIYSVGYWDAVAAIQTRKSTLDKYRIRIPTVDEPWTAEEFAALQKKIADSGDFEHVIDYGVIYPGEWWPYAFSPFLQSFGGDLVNRDDYQSAEGVLNGPEAVAFAEWWRSQFTDGYAMEGGNEERTEFRDGKVAMQWAGNWDAPANLEAFDDMVFLPPPDFGNGPVVGAGSWQWATSSSCTEEEAAGALAYLKFSLDDKYVAEFSDGTGLIPATSGGAAATTAGKYGPGEPFEVFTEISSEHSEIRPPTPAYVNIALVFEKGLRDITDGADPQESLDQMVSEIDADIDANGGYTN